MPKVSLESALNLQLTTASISRTLRIDFVLWLISIDLRNSKMLKKFNMQIFKKLCIISEMLELPSIRMVYTDLLSLLLQPFEHLFSFKWYMFKFEFYFIKFESKTFLWFWTIQCLVASIFQVYSNILSVYQQKSGL